jgi:uncharacterized RDD family membrane protein YckC
VLPYGGPTAAGYERFASFGQRMLAWLIDGAVLLAVRLGVVLVLGLVALGIERAGLETETVKVVGGWVVLALLYLCAWPYYALLEAGQGQGTLGKRAVGIQVEDVEGGRATLAQTSVRFFLRPLSAVILGIGFLMAAFTRRRQAMHDIGANCVVTVRPQTFRPYAPPPTVGV